MDHQTDLHFDYELNPEPQFMRVRSNTWPQKPSREPEPQNSPIVGEEASNGADHQTTKDPLGLTAKKSGSRRNAWGNLSYADLITKAIHSSPEKRLTLSQIYDWMVQNVPYFKDKGDSTSSAGWKNSIRHNLSLHSRFMRIQNEGTGKSSWWVLNPDAKPGKTPRRRAGSMEQTKCYEKKRGRIRKKLEGLRANLENGILSPNGCDDFLDGLGYVGNFRERTGSSTSNCSRLSPISAMAEADLSSNVGQSISSNHWSSEVSNSPTMYPENVYSVVPLLGGMNLSNHNNFTMDIANSMNGTYLSDSSSDYSQSSPGVDSQYPQLPTPSPYISQQQQQQQMNAMEFHPQNINNTQSFNNAPQLHVRPNPVNNGPASFSPAELYNENYSDSVLGMKPDALSPVHMSSPGSLTVNTHLNSPEQGSPNSGPFTHHSPHQGLQPQTGHASGLTQHACQLSPQQNGHLRQQHPSSAMSLQQQQALHQAACDSILRDALTRGAAGFRPPTATNGSSPALTLPHQGSGNMNNIPCSGFALNSNQFTYFQALNAGHFHGKNTNCTHNHAVSFHGVGGVGSSTMGLPVDIDMELMSMSAMDYDMEQVIKNEIMFEGKLDFTFDSGAAAVGQNVVH
ncbi:unnamed protein product [Candidula unifasciata]|uniref:Forkhead box protein O n=1 Tax=Candidula unifasciata TaxID=100452 RepID=A0A8S3ZM78_9EUPU|nr:unnamed protein product [Candidula unifasciata]